LAPATVRRHLDILQRDWLVTYTSVKKPTGRPEHVYILTEQGQEILPKNYAQLLTSLVEELKALEAKAIRGKSGTEVLELSLRHIADRLVQQRAGEVDGKDLEARIRVLVDTLQHEDFVPEVKRQRDGALHIRLLNCPFRAVAMGDSAICTFDQHLISTFLGTQVTKVECISEGSPSCRYVAALDK